MFYFNNYWFIGSVEHSRDNNVPLELSSIETRVVPITDVSTSSCKYLLHITKNIIIKDIYYYYFLLGSISLDGIQPLDETILRPCTQVSSKNNYTIPRRRRVCLRDISVTRSKYMTPKKQFLYKAVVDM